MPSMLKYVAAFAAACIAPAFAQSSEPTPNGADVLKQSNAPVKTITKVFSQLFMYSLPKGFVPAFEDGCRAKGVRVIWHFLITLTPLISTGRKRVG